MKTLATTGSAYKYLYHDSLFNCTYPLPEELCRKLISQIPEERIEAEFEIMKLRNTFRF